MAKGRQAKVAAPVQRVAARPPRRWWPWGVGAAALVVAGATAAYVLSPRVRPANPGGPRASRPLNILLVTLDTTRADHLGCYGWARARTSGLDGLAGEGVRFARAYSPVPITLPAHASVLTGLYPFAHGVRNNGNFYLGEKVETLATVLRGRGYRTAAFVSSFVLDRRYGLNRGFETYDDRMQTEGEGAQIVDLEAERRGDHTAAAVDAWLTAYAPGATGPFFVWVHLYDPHEPYAPPSPFREAFADAPYDGEIAFDDALVGQLLERLGELGLRDRTVVAVTGDHGESLGEHGEETHTLFVYEGAIRVPLIVWRPGLVPAGVVVGDPVRLTDVAPTLLDLVGAPPLATGQGQSLRPLMEGRALGAAPTVYAETLLPQLYMNWAPLRAVVEERWKYIEAPKPELYDLEADPGERQNVYGARPQTARGLAQALTRLTGGAAGALSVGTLDRETLEKLASLGYVGAGAEAPVAADGATRPDPKDMIGVFNRLRHANTAVNEGRLGEALPVFREILAADPHNAFAQLLVANAYKAAKDFRRAIVEYRKYLELVPANASVHTLLATCYVSVGDAQNAMREADAALAIDPHFSDARVLKSDVLTARHDYAGALAELRVAVEADPAKPRLRFELGKVLSGAGQVAAAETQYGAALELEPDYAPALAGLGTLYARQGKYAEAVQTLERALAANPRQDEARYNLATVYEQMGRPADARTELQRLVETPGTMPAVAAAARQHLAGLGGR